MTSDELTISEAAERTGLTRHTLRYYERDGLMLGVGRAGSGHRRYSERDLGWIELITKLRATGMPSYYAGAIDACESPDSYLSSPRLAAASVPR